MWNDIHPGLRRWRAEGQRFALATVVEVRGSAPRDPGAAMAVSENGEVLGSLSGGCIEADVYEHALGVLADGSANLVRYGITDAGAFEVGLTCGGEIAVLIEPVDDHSFPHIDQVLERIGAGQSIAVATWLSGERGRHLVLDPGPVQAEVSTDPADVEVASLLGRYAGTPGAHVVELCAPGSRDRATPEPDRVLLQTHGRPRQMFIFGAVDVTAALSELGTFLGYRVTVCDARPVFATADRFPGAAEVVVDHPHRFLAKQQIEPGTVICVLTHDPKFDVPVLQVALSTDADYIGVMGSRASHDDRLRRLREAGVIEQALSRLRSPIGLDLGGRTPQETALSIVAEIVAATAGRSGLPLREVNEPIHGQSMLFAVPRGA